MLDTAKAGISDRSKFPANERIAFTLPEVFALTGLSLTSLNRFIADGPLKSIKPVGRRLIRRGDENNRPQTTQFISLLKHLARDCAFLLLAHPSSKSYRHEHRHRNKRLDRLEQCCAIAALFPNRESKRRHRAGQKRTLEGMKSNYGVPGGKIDVEWKNGVFVPVRGLIGVDKMAAERKAEDKFLALLKRFIAQKRNASDRKGTSFAPALFAGEPGCEGITKQTLEAAMKRLLISGQIRVLEFGPPSHVRTIAE